MSTRDRNPSIANIQPAPGGTTKFLAGNGTWQTPAGGGGGGGLVFIANTILTADSTSVTFSSLDGNTDGVYRLVARVKFAATCNVVLQVNGSSTNIAGAIWDRNGYDSAGIYIMNVAINDYVVLSMDIHAKYNPNSQAFKRPGTGTSSRTGSGPQVIVWEFSDTTTNITSLVLLASVASALGNGSSFALYKYAQA